MSSCNGDGKCLTQCECKCYNEETDEYNEVCVCGHREHNGYCPSKCCRPIKCSYKYCNIKQPEWVSWCYKGLCVNCSIQIGDNNLHFPFSEVGDCCVCLENKTMIILRCNHIICDDCCYSITKEGFNNEQNLLCPLCRNLNDLGK